MKKFVLSLLCCISSISFAEPLPSAEEVLTKIKAHQGNFDTLTDNNGITWNLRVKTQTSIVPDQQTFDSLFGEQPVGGTIEKDDLNATLSNSGTIQKDLGNAIDGSDLRTFEFGAYAFQPSHYTSPIFFISLEKELPQ